MAGALRLTTFTLALSVFLPLSLFGQGTVEGTVTEAESGEPIPGVQVAVQETTVGTVTQADGSFEVSGVPTGFSSNTVYPVSITTLPDR